MTIPDQARFDYRIGGHLSLEHNSAGRAASLSMQVNDNEGRLPGGQTRRGEQCCVNSDRANPLTWGDSLMRALTWPFGVAATPIILGPLSALTDQDGPRRHA